MSHHPPVSAFYCDSDDFSITGYLYLKTKLSLASFEIIPMGETVVKLFNTGETFGIK